MSERIAAELTPRQILPAAAQGVIGIECRDDRDELRTVLRHLENATSKRTTTAERAVSRMLEASCESPIASYATTDGKTLTLESLVASPDGKQILHESVSGDPDDADALGRSLAARLLELGAADLLAGNV